ncbi:MAG: outer membrane beta-barrel protein [Bacteroidales bacterium]|nr:outer membrane beta-barrel protein [Bacteroidales bacterium]
MKRTLILLAALGLALGGRAQADSTATCASADYPKWGLSLGISASATLFANGNDMSPYYSKYGFALHIPLMINYRHSPHWTFSAGLQYDFQWAPLRYRVEEVGFGEGLDFPSGPVQGTQHAHAFHGYLGFPLQATWYPFRSYGRRLYFGFDIHPAYAVTRHISITDRVLSRTGGSTEAGDVSGDFMRPWKLEVGVTLGTTAIGLLHGVRFYANLLPTYHDAVSDEDIYTAGIQFFL